MADEELDPLAFITENCRYTSSQEELLSVAKFAREDETFPDEDESPAVEGSGVSRRKLDGADDSGVKHGGELAVGAANSGTSKKLGFRGERKGESSGTKLEGICGVERKIEHQLKGKEKEIEPQLKKYRVSPLVHCSGKMVIEGENDGDEVVVFSGDLKVEKVSSLRSVAPENAGCTEKLSIEDNDVHIECETRRGKRATKKLDFDLNTEVINVEENEDIGEMGNVDKEAGNHRQGSGKVEDDKKQGDGVKTREEGKGIITRRGKRELPRSMFGLVWGEGTGDANENGNVEGGSKEANVEEEKDGDKSKGDQGGGEVFGDVESGSKEANVEANRVEKSESNGGEAMRCVLDVLRMLVNQKCSDDDDGEVDILETAKRCGMTFPRSRFLPEVEEDE